MSRAVTVRFIVPSIFGINSAEESEKFSPSPGQEYYLTLETLSANEVRLTTETGFQMLFSPPETTKCYIIVREGWSEATTVPITPKTVILESALIIVIEPVRGNSSATCGAYIIYKLPRTLNGLLVDRGYCNQETVVDCRLPEAVGELQARASFMLKTRHDHLRYFCTSFRIDNLTAKKCLTKTYGGDIV